MELKHGRVHDVCEDCGAEILVGPMSSFMQTLLASGFDGISPVIVHKLPLCPQAADRAERAWKEIRSRAEDEMSDARTAALEVEKEKREHREAQRNKQQPQSRK